MNPNLPPKITTPKAEVRQSPDTYQLPENRIPSWEIAQRQSFERPINRESIKGLVYLVDNLPGSLYKKTIWKWINILTLLTKQFQNPIKT